MAGSNSTSPVVPAYFECPKDAPSVLTLILALDGVTSAMAADSITHDDHEQVERVECLGIAAHVLARQLRDRFTTRPLTKRQLDEGHKARAEWLAARERLAGPAEGRA